MEKVEKCIICKTDDLKILFKKESPIGESFTLIKCRQCGLQFLSPRPTEEEIKKYYERKYFTRRTDRGYNDYFSSSLKAEIERVFKLNLKDLNFFDFEKGLNKDKRLLDIGCAAGYFLNYMNKRGFDVTGVDVSKCCVDFARTSKLNVKNHDYLKIDFCKRFHLITLWATIEHLHHPQLVIKKAYQDLEDNGMLFISTCRIGGFNFMRLFGKRWRYYNFPEHLFFFSYKNLSELLRLSGFKVIRFVTYGSGIWKRGTLTKKVADFIAKKFFTGDMMLIQAKKITTEDR